MLDDIAMMSDNGTPYVLGMHESDPVVQLYEEIARKVDAEISELKENKMQCNYEPMAG